MPIPAPDHGHDGAPSAPWMQEQLLSADPDPLSRDPTYENKHVRPGRAGQAYTAGVRLTLRTVTVTSSSVVRDKGLSFLIGLRGPFCASASTVTAQCWTREPSAAESGARSSLRSLSVHSAKLSLLFILLSHLRAGASPAGWL